MKAIFKNPLSWFIIDILLIIPQPFLFTWLMWLQWDKALAADPGLMDCGGGSVFLTIFVFAYAGVFCLWAFVMMLITKIISKRVATVCAILIFAMSVLPLLVINLLQFINL